VISKAKFLFDQDFGPFADPAEKPIAPADHTIKLAEAESRGFRDGFEAAEKEAAALAARRTVVALEQIGDALNRLARDLTNIERRIEDEAIELAVTVARKLAPELVSREPLAEVCALGAECSGSLPMRRMSWSMSVKRCSARHARGWRISPAPAASRAASW
jgi:flagellar assembly protein FliH